MGSDDTYSLKIVETAKKAIDNNPEIKMVSGNVVLSRENSKDKDVKLPSSIQDCEITPDNIESLLQLQSFSFLGDENVIDRKVILKLGALREKFLWHADWLLYLLLSLKNPISTTYLRFTKQH